MNFYARKNVKYAFSLKIHANMHEKTTKMNSLGYEPDLWLA